MQPLYIKGKTVKDVREDYDAFVDKFKPNRTTDDCFTPPEVYEAVLGWLREEGAIGTDTPIVRPFWPGGDYTKETYPEGCCVVDNPPFSIMTSILRHYTERGVRFFLFAPGLTLSSSACSNDATCVATDSAIRYTNGARVRTGFITNLPAFSQWAVMTSPKLARCIDDAMLRIRVQEKATALPVYIYPQNVVTPAGILKLAKHVGIRIPRCECTRIRRMDAQIPLNKSIFGNGFLCSDRVAAELKTAELKTAELKAAEQKTVYTFQLSERERQIVEELNLHS